MCIREQTTRPQSKIALETADVELECLASGQPPAKVSWYKNGESIIASEYFVVEPNKFFQLFPWISDRIGNGSTRCGRAAKLRFEMLAS
ncbi:unnamed protein product, partial [Caenorhabditis auriculariae]